MQNFTVRVATPCDIEVLTSLLGELFSIEKDFQFNEKLQKKGLQLMLDNPNGVVLVAELDQTIIGMATGQLLISTAEGGPSLLIEDVIISQKHRGIGIGKNIVDSVCRWATTFGAKRLQLLADVSNINGLKFYEKIGWTRTNLICLRKT
ncbi:MAG: GNAT family N-acetyltransferase [Desulfotalea sp.]